MLRAALAALISFALLVPAWGQDPVDIYQRKKKKKTKKQEEPVTQVLPLPKDLPGAITVETQRLIFHVSPISTKGLLTQQTRDAIRALWGQTRGATIVKLRAFVAGSGDTRRIQQLVSEMFAEHKSPLPALSTVLVGSLGTEGAQVIIEAISLDKRNVNPNGLAFISGQAAKSYAESLAGLRAAVRAAGATESDLLRVTCFVNSFEGTERDRQANPPLGGAYTLVQMRREAAPTVAECEAVARLSKAPSTAVQLLNPEGLTKSPNYSQIALVSAQKIVFSSLQMAFHSQDADIKLAYERLGRMLESQGVRYADVFMMSTYALSQDAIDKVRAVRFNYFDKNRPPASTLLPFEGLPALEASFGVEVVAAAQ